MSDQLTLNMDPMTEEGPKLNIGVQGIRDGFKSDGQASKERAIEVVTEHSGGYDEEKTHLMLHYFNCFAEGKKISAFYDERMKGHHEKDGGLTVSDVIMASDSLVELECEIASALSKFITVDEVADNLAEDLIG